MLYADVLIVGAGPAGSTTAKYLSLGGIDNILIQRNFNFRKPCGGGIRIDGFDEFNIDKSLIKKRVDSFAVVSKSQRVDIDISDRPIGIVDRVEFDTALREKAIEAGSRVLEAAFISLEIFDEYIISKIKKDGEIVEIKSHYVIGADGVNSKVRKLVNGDEVSASLTHYTDLVTTEYDVCEFHFGEAIAENHYAWAFPHIEGSNIGTIVDDKHLKNFITRLNIEEESKHFGYKIPIYKNTIFYKDRVFFVGDSASQVLPFTYEGIYYSMGSAKLLADIIIQKRKPKEYEIEWNKKYKKKFDILLKLQTIFLYNDFMIWVMMRFFKSRHIQNRLVELWLGDKLPTLDISFFYRVIKRVLHIDKG